MKIIFLAFFLLLAFSTTLPSAIASLVYDTDGEPLLNSAGSYYIVGKDGGLALGKAEDEPSKCPLTVVQVLLHDGLPARFSSPIKFPYIQEGWRISINFTEAPECVPRPSKWEVVEEVPLCLSVKHKGKGFLGDFKIERYGTLSYKLVYCHRGVSVCRDLGIYKGALVVRDGNPYIVRFKKGAIQSSGKWNIVE